VWLPKALSIGVTNARCLDRYVVAEVGSNIVEAAFFVSHPDQSPAAVRVKDLYPEDRGAPSFICFIWLSPPLARSTPPLLSGETAWPDD
jgi:hypothetical protein